MDPLKRRRTDNDVAGELCRRFGVLAVQKGFITSEELKTAVVAQIDDDVNGREHRLLGNILFDSGQITEEQIGIVLQELKKTLR